MNYTEDHNGEQVTLHNLAYMIYQAYGQEAVHAFARDIAYRGEAISWGECTPCEDSFSPVYDGACLVCATDN
jgi:hypothetical protein